VKAITAGSGSGGVEISGAVDRHAAPSAVKATTTSMRALHSAQVRVSERRPTNNGRVRKSNVELEGRMFDVRSHLNQMYQLVELGRHDRLKVQLPATPKCLENSRVLEQRIPRFFNIDFFDEV
jgi:hypothetical protein